MQLVAMAFASESTGDLAQTQNLPLLQLLHGHIHIFGECLLWICLSILTLLLLLPSISFLFTGWQYRTEAILNSFSDAAKLSYFQQFYPRYRVANQESAAALFHKYYSNQIGASIVFDTDHYIYIANDNFAFLDRLVIRTLAFLQRCGYVCSALSVGSM
jgi:hypothetical protein